MLTCYARHIFLHHFKLCPFAPVVMIITITAPMMFVFWQNGGAHPSSTAPALWRGCEHDGGSRRQDRAGRIRRRRRRCWTHEDISLAGWLVRKSAAAGGSPVDAASLLLPFSESNNQYRLFFLFPGEPEHFVNFLKKYFFPRKAKTLCQFQKTNNKKHVFFLLFLWNTECL